MLFFVMLIWMIGILLLFANFRNRSTRWASLTLFCGAAGGLSEFIRIQMKPLFESNSDVFQYLLLAENITAFVSHCLTPYAFLLFGIIYSEFVPRKYISILQFFFFIPTIGMLMFYPVHPVFVVPYYLTTFWVVPYTFLGIIFLLVSYMVEKNPFTKRSRLFTCLGFIPLMANAVITSYFLDIMEVVERDHWAALFFFVVCIISLFRFGFVGARLRVQRQSLNYSIQRFISEVSVMNHGMKNDLGLIKLYGDTIKEYAITTNQANLQSDIDVVLQVHEKMQKTMMRIQQQTRDQKLHVGEHRVMDMVEKCLSQLKAKLNDSNIEIINSQCEKSHLTICCDRLLIEEVIDNIVSNAIEAMPSGGKLTISMDENRRNVLLIFKDTGTGISKEHFPRILEPFFSTKSNPRENFGLGLSFCYNVINKHGGKIDFYTKSKKGTTVYLAFPKKRGRTLWKRFVS